jgi:hypothetical protein
MKHKLFVKKNIVFLLILLVIICGAFLRIYNLDSQSFWMDEGYSINAALSTLEKGYPVLDSGKEYGGQIIYTYFLAGSIKLFGFHNWSARLPSVIFNLLFLLAVFLFVKKFFDKKTALLTFVFLTFSYWEIAWARQARNYALFQLFFWLSLYFFWSVLYKYKKKYLVLCLIFSLATFFTHSLGLLLLPIYLISFLIVYGDKISYHSRSLCHSRVLCHSRESGNPVLNKFKIITKNLKIILLSIFIFLTAIFFYNPIILAFKESTLIFTFYLPHYSNFIWNNFPITLILAILSVFLYLNKKTIEKINLLLVIYFLPLLILSVFVYLMHYRYLFMVLPVLYILSSLTIVYFLEYFFCHSRKGGNPVAKKNNIKFFLTPFIFLAIILFIIFSSEFQKTPQTIYALESDNTKQKLSYYSYTPQPDWQKAYQYIKDNQKENDIVISAQPVFNKIYLNKPGYWIYYSYCRKSQPYRLITENNTEYYINAKVIDDLEELKKIIQENHGFILLDYMSKDDRIKEEILNYIYRNTDPVFFDKINPWSKVWVYRF